MVPQARAPNSHSPLTKREKCVRAVPGSGRERSYRRQSTDRPRGEHLLMRTTTRRRAVIAATAALALVPATAAYAATIQGGPGNERLRGTNAVDLIDGNAGNDRIHGRA